MVKGIVKRGVTELVTPGVTFNEQVWIPKNNFLLSLHKEKKFGIALVDVSTGEFLVAEGNLENFTLFTLFDPAEIIFPKNCRNSFST